MDNPKNIVERSADAVWKFFSSVKLAVVLLIILAILSIIGTVIQQNEAPEHYLREYSRSTVDLFETLGFFDMYHTWWYVLLLFLFTANLTVCTLDRFPASWKLMRAPLKPIEDDAVKALPLRKELILTADLAGAGERVKTALQARGYRPSEFKGAGGLQLVSQKGAYSRMGVYITHLSILLIFAGALIGAFFGFKAYLNLPEGKASSWVYLRNEPMWSQIMDALGIMKSPVVNNPSIGVPSMPLGYHVYCDSFDVDYYVGPSGMPTGMPSEYHSTLSIYDLDRKKILEKRIRVNDPLTYKGITFYQSSYGPVPEASGIVILNIRRRSEPPSAGQDVSIAPGAAVPVPSIDRSIRVLGFAPYAMRMPDNGQVRFFRTDNDEYINPAVEIEVLKAGKAIYKTTILKTDPAPPPLPEDCVITYRGFWGTRYTGLQVTKDPGVWVVYLGFIMLCIGPFIAFFGSHRKLWVRLQERKGETVVLVAGTANRNRFAFERDFNKIAADLSR